MHDVPQPCRADREIAATRNVTTRVGRIAVRDLATATPTTGWQQYSAGDGAKRPQYYSWALIGLEPKRRRWHRAAAGASQRRHGRAHRRARRRRRFAYHLCHAPRPVPVRALVRVAGQRWRIEENFQAAKGHVGLDQHQVRR